jgi:hypothetical protein
MGQEALYDDDDDDGDDRSLYCRCPGELAGKMW